ncbi:hypothetical protein [Methylobacterium sp. J-076]|uniref:hypothetical protein n=1 Tax=Methylobacterium sp. J-076 TaxID=2836655 RepID=UPI001FBA3331|nr:hypothetical protein [Methylobacterium sp. J-076]MCJ2015725.1 hypothetical protein [Methylobacterium sp. J-076]
MTRLALLLVAVLASGGGLATERPTRAQLCAGDLPEGAHLPALPACRAASAPARRADGFRDWGNGLSVRVGGRVGADYGVTR